MGVTAFPLHRTNKKIMKHKELTTQLLCITTLRHPAHKINKVKKE